MRDAGLLESSLSQPLATYAGRELYPSVVMKAARLAFGVARNHPFVDGNKRVAAAVLGAVLDVNGYALDLRDLELSDAVLALAGGEMDRDAWGAWVTGHTRQSR